MKRKRADDRQAEKRKNIATKPKKQPSLKAWIAWALCTSSSLALSWISGTSRREDLEREVSEVTCDPLAMDSSCLPQ